jgi:DNA polymerase III delta subunit
MREANAMKPAYLIGGTDDAKIDAALARLRERAARDGGTGSLESFDPPDGQGPPDVAALIAALPALSLIPGRRYLVADRLERVDARGLARLGEALGGSPAETTVVLVERRDPAARKPAKARIDALKALAGAVREAGGEVLAYDAPSGRDLPQWVVAEARRRSLKLDTGAARVLVERMGESTVRLANELDRLSLWAGPGGSVDEGDLEAMVADTSEEVSWAFTDALLSRDAAAALAAAERLAAQGESLGGLVYQAAKRLREAHAAASGLEAGRTAKEVEASLRMHPYAAKMLIRRVGGTSPAAIRAAAGAVADLEWWTRGGADYPDDVALTLATRRAAGGNAA